jgi:hypothetical protein
MEESENFLADLDTGEVLGEGERGSDFRTIVAEFDPEATGRPN